MNIRTALAALLLACLPLLIPAPSEAQGRRLSHCIAIADAGPGIEYLHRAAWTDPVPARSVRLHYIGHSMFLIRTESDLTIVTDYNGNLGATAFRPDVVTMNHAHSSHWSDDVEGIDHVLRGWSADQFGVAADHHVEIGDLLIRNVPTMIRSFGAVEENGNSIFVFETANLCIAHLGHLHHEPTDAQYAALGRVDVLMVPVDGRMTMDLASMVRVVDRLKSSVVIPMHWFSAPRLDSFLSAMSDHFQIARPGSSEVTLTLNDLPDRPTVLVLDPQPLVD
ncbi:MBL fold metallo-hydrolase [Paracoccus sp. (in: a-proteobacteria)]|uniref:MBL fold metallo-hydrolase n=1 Tax=Paracoccus sp. TaxID=267 RepID=UPI003A8B895B